MRPHGSKTRLADAAMERAWALEEAPVRDAEALFHAYLVAARAGNVDAMNNVGLHYAYGDGVRRDAALGARWLRRAALKGDALAAFNLGLFYAQGRGLRKNPAMARKWYWRSLSSGNLDAAANLADLLFASKDPKDWPQAVALYRQSMKRGNTAARYNLGLAYEQGKGTRRNRKKALQLYREAAEAGDVDAQLALGWCYLNGVGGPQDSLAAFRWYEQAARQREPRALFSLGEMFLEGLGIPPSQERALRYLRAAAELGHARSRRWLKHLEREPAPDTKPEAGTTSNPEPSAEPSPGPETPGPA
ncbi:SEL1-like repeat protein [Hyalangium rubrum]|uniref:Tetratricopeptide repeat protein n=1 Tax=Hyalangium rubrum TaxID=3103134 RepID=A0ABU5GYE5_9BACT|nr:tetratricopeptide repeat protein [Hyalangium sp. s54d21]MDY7226203.1 tetratricopeptide repeat protein [Hyalangium sp. s54d21]